MRSALRRAVIAAGVATTATAVLATVSGGASAAPPEAAVDHGGVTVEIPGPEHGNVAGSGHTEVPAAGRNKPSGQLSSAEAAQDGELGKLVNTGRTKDRLDVVIIGDGYTAAQQAKFHADAKAKWAEVAAVEPYTTYRNLFNVWTVDAVSKQSGVTGDPEKGVVRNTALGSYFWCDDIERLLCIDQTKVDKYVAKAPDADLVIVLANSTKYGGAGYNQRSAKYGYEGISTASAGNEQSGQVAIHETGHSLGKLADEYFYPGYPGYEKYDGPEVDDVNVSVLTARKLAEQRTKWYRWLGETSPDGGKVGAYEGGGYYVKGLYRPTDSSMMRVLDKPFNLPGVEAMIAGFHRHANPVTPLTPTDATLRPGKTVKISVPRLTGKDGRQFTIRWYLDGKELRSLRGKTKVAVADLAGRLADGKTHKLGVAVEDRTPSVRDPKITAQLKSKVRWNVHR
ncbi:M64 family metallopeptidase [Streptomyces bambusae]|uniref:M64 family metallopeptidase n=1 Tax=Streptomyces bambusae TaxID=1550616 RepID=UPI001CFD45C6|nr:M64 family metallopeptidase [Streptomyces bambusae]MCB5165770.1 M64 family metallopeptidase [Streptomyces bambusae]